jgi:hypothetical protein
MHTWLRWGCLSLWYLAFAGSLSKAEGVAAVLTGAFGAMLSLGLRTRGELRFPLRGRWAEVLAQQALQLARDIGRVSVTLVRVLIRRRGYRGQVELDRDAPEHSVGRGSGRRAVTALLASLTPDSVALDTGDEAITVHRLSRMSAATRKGRSGR